GRAHGPHSAAAPDRRKRGTPGDHLGAHRGGVDPTRNRKFESISLQRRVCELSVPLQCPTRFSHPAGHPTPRCALANAERRYCPRSENGATPSAARQGGGEENGQVGEVIAAG